MTQMSRIDEIRERASKATKGEWWYCEDEKFFGYGDTNKADTGIFISAEYDWSESEAKLDIGKDDADFIAHSRSDIEYLLSEIDRLNAEQQCVDALLTNLYEYAGVANNIYWIRDDIDKWRSQYRKPEIFTAKIKKKPLPPNSHG